ncbi:MAG: DUF4253 domain-containing protein [Micropepsaceae bacterium]
MSPVTIPQLPIETRKIRGASALAEWEQLRKSTSHYPLIVGDNEDLARLSEQRAALESEHRTVQEILEKAASFNYPEDFRLRKKKDAEELKALIKKKRQDPKIDEAYKAFDEKFPNEDIHQPQHGEWPTTPPGYTPLSILEKSTLQGKTFQRRIIDEAVVLMLPTADWTEAFAMLNYGGWNECPQPHEHIAAFRRWRDRFGLELVAMSSDTLELRPARHPQTREDALALALEQYEFCPDLVDQGGPLEELAAGLLAGNWWYFWWD